MTEFENRIRAIRRWKIDKAYEPPSESISVNYDELSPEQKLIVSAVTTQLDLPQQVQHANPVHSIVQGAGGTGKTAVLMHLSNLFKTRLRKDQYIIAAYTGVAAHNICAQTIHSAFKIKPVCPYEDLLKNLDASSKLLSDLSKVDFILLDEFSLIGLSLFGFIDLLFRRARPYYSQIPFEGTSVVLFGDVFQTLPVKDLPVFVPLSSQSLEGEFLRNAAYAYRSFQRVFLLDTAMRQSGQSASQVQFRNLLAKIRISKSDYLTAELLMTRLHNRLSEEEQDLFTNALHVFETNADVEEYNRKTLKERFPTEKIFSFHNSNHPKVNVTLSIAVGSPVILLKNKHVGAGLVNGSVGYVRDIIFTSGSSFLLSHDKRPLYDRVHAIIVDLRGYHGPVYTEGSEVYGVPILRVMDSFEIPDSGRVITYIRFPLKLCFATTKHKVVGLNLDRIAIGFSDCQLFAGLDYVSLSRVKRLEDIMIIDDNLNLKRLRTRNNEALRGLLQQRVEQKRLQRLATSLL